MKAMKRCASEIGDSCHANGLPQCALVIAAEQDDNEALL